ncbi:hypothetical protein FPE01S_01_15210 [Flavihumibacter petaseus NBRC 106054]|uniref:PsbP C-terminal domain-containing protein n=1 Tax=Flavihumibacter petaseus NBRC 106054 TaxID=1220578 RepID=A0A0E9MYM1_9BACT|nr:hypothetical protein FPE01S_01_15210 [Flavihumibacter petaseus NBRC 106054]
MSITVQAQDPEEKSFTIRLQRPTGWYATPEGYWTTEFYKTAMMSREMRKKYKEASKQPDNTTLLYSFIKYDGQDRYNPSISVQSRKEEWQTLLGLRVEMSGIATNIKKLFREVQTIDEIQETTVGGYPAVYYSVRYLNQLFGSTTALRRSRYYLVLVGDYVINFDLRDNETDENCTDIYRYFMESVQLSL